MSEIAKILPYSIDLNENIGKTPLPTLFATDDDQAHRFELTVRRNGAPVDLTGVTVQGYFIRCSDRKTEKVKGSGDASGKATLTLNKYCYLMPGKFVLTIKLEKDGVKSSIFHGEGGMQRSMTDSIEDDERIILGIDDILAHIDAMEEAEKAANDAAASANAAASRTPYIDEATSHWMMWNAEAGGYVDSGVEATGPNGADGRTPHIGDNGNWWTGDTDTGVKAQGPAGQNGTGSGTVTAITINGTQYEPNGQGVVDLGEQIGAEGPQGPGGYTPQRGTDYWTEEDQAQIVSDVLAALPNASGVSF